MTHPGVGPLTALAFVPIIGEAKRFQCGKQAASYLGLVPLEDSSGNRRRLGHLTKQGYNGCSTGTVQFRQIAIRSHANAVEWVLAPALTTKGTPDPDMN